MSLRLFIAFFLLWSLAVNHLFGQVIADFTFDDTSDMPASLLINQAGIDATEINPFTRSDGEGIYTLTDPADPEADQNINMQVPEDLLTPYESIQLEFDFRPQENFAWLIYSGYNRLRFAHHEENGGLHLRYSTAADPSNIIESGYVGAIPKGERATVMFNYIQETGIAYIILNGHILWQTPEDQRTPGERLIWETEDGYFYIAANSNGDGSSIPSFYSFRACLSASPPTVSNDTICVGNSAVLTASGADDGQYRWFEQDGETLIDGEVNSTFATPPLDSPGTYTYYVSVQNQMCESTLVPVTVVVQPEPQQPAVKVSEHCGPGEAVVEIENATQDLQYVWYSTPNSGKLHQGSSLRLNVSKDTLVYVRADNGWCHGEALPVNIKVKDLPFVDAGPDTTILKGDRIQLEATGEYTNIRWTTHESLENPDSPTPLVMPEYTHTYTVTAVNEDGCEVSDRVTVLVLDKFPVPNAFSPNNDGLNDTWEIPNIEKYPECKILVFNRWGNQVFSSEGYQQAWDGTHDGQPLPTGTYYYTLQLSHEHELVKGSVVILR